MKRKGKSTPAETQSDSAGRPTVHKKQLSQLENAGQTSENQFFADEEHPALKLRDQHFERCLFARIGLKKAELDKTTFHRCVFVDCYLRCTRFHNVDFTGSFFKDCNLERAAFESCCLRYVRFRHCHLSYDELLNCLPSEPNIAILLLKSLRANAVEMRDTEVVDRLLACQIGVEMQELRNRVRGASEYYRSRYEGIDRLLSLVSLVSLMLSGWIWGHGMSLKPLLRSASVVILAFAFLFYLYGSFSPEIAGSSEGFLKSLYLSVATFTSLGLPNLTPASGLTFLLCALESVLGIVFLGFLGAAVYRRFAR